MKIFHGPNSCSLGTLILLEEIGEPYEVERLDMKGRQHYGEEYRKVNPKSVVPALQLDDGSVVTEWGAIAFYLASQYPQANLLPADVLGKSLVLGVVDYVVATVHMQGFRRYRKPTSFVFSEDDHETVKRVGIEMMEKSFGILADSMVGPYVFEEFSIADAALFYVENWAVNLAGMTLPGKCQAHMEAMMARPTVKTILEREELAMRDLA